MKTAALTVFLSLLFIANTNVNSNTPTTNSKIDATNKSGFDFYVYKSNINTKYTEIPSAIFRNKLIMVSTKKIGGLGNGIDQKTNEPFSELFCLDIDAYGTLSNPLFFSRIINTKGNEGQVAFTPDEKTMYFTRSSRENSDNYKLYKTILEENSNGNWIYEVELSISSNQYSIENPFITKDGKYLYFSSNMPQSIGGFDIYKSKINADGTLDTPKNLGPTINTSKDEKYPHFSKDEKSMYFSSNGFNGIGGFDIYESKLVFNQFNTPRNLGKKINSKYDEIGFVFLSEDKGFFSSSKHSKNGSFDIFRFKANPIYQTLQGIIVNEVNNPLPNTTVILLDAEGTEIERQITGIDAYYSFKVKAFENYSIHAIKSGFNTYETSFTSSQIEKSVYKEVLQLKPTTYQLSKK
jgi:hypothetical protein